MTLEEEFILIIVPSLYPAKSKCKQWHTSILIGVVYTWEILQTNEVHCKKEFQMDSHVFQAITNH